LATALGKSVAIVGFMGAGKSTLAQELAERLGWVATDLDAEIEETVGLRIPEIFQREGEAGFRKHEARAAVILANPNYLVSLGGGAVESEDVRSLLKEYAITLWLDVDVETAWDRTRGSDRPHAGSERDFRRLYDKRRPLYEEVADFKPRDLDDAVLAAAGVHVGLGLLDRLADLIPGEGPVALVTDRHVAGIHGADAQLALGKRLVSTHEVTGKSSAELEGLWRSLRLDRGGTIVALGGGTTTDLAGFAAATYMRGVDWVAVPTSLVGQVDAAVGGKTAIDLPEAKNLVGAFHWPVRTVIDPALLTTLPEEERRNGLAEVVKTGLLAGEPLWELPDPELVRRCAAYKAALCLADPYDQGARRALNLGHTFGHALEAASGYELSHGRAVALGLLAALRLSGRDTAPVEETLAPEPVRVDRARAWEALLRDKKGRLRLVLLRDDHVYVDQEMPEADVRAALDALIAE